MIRLSKIEWQNIYYMLCFAVDEIAYMSDSNIAYEDVETTYDLFGELLNKAFVVVYNEHFLRQYLLQNFDTSKPRGRINLEMSYQNGAAGKGMLNCDVSCFDIDNQYNQAIKAGFLSLLNYGDDREFSDNIKCQLVQNLNLLSGITSKELTLDLIGDSSNIPTWYKPIRFVLLIIYQHHMAWDEKGDCPLYDLTDADRLCWIFEKFVRNYCHYKYGLSGQLFVSQPRFPVKQFYGNRWCELDLLLESKTDALIVDMKWYNSNKRGRNDDVRQITDYMRRYIFHDYGRNYGIGHVNGLLLYASSFTEYWNAEEFTKGVPDDGMIYMADIGLKQDWDNILSDLDGMLLKYIGWSPYDMSAYTYAEHLDQCDFVCDCCKERVVQRRFASGVINGVEKRICADCYQKLMNDVR